jgi:hypothetical protein
LSVAQQRRLLDTIARQSRNILVPGRNTCPCSPVRLFCPEVTPDQFEDNIALIAASVKSALDRAEQKRTFSFEEKKKLTIHPISPMINQDQSIVGLELKTVEPVEIPINEELLSSYSPRLVGSPTRTLSSSSHLSPDSSQEIINHPG